MLSDVGYIALATDSAFTDATCPGKPDIVLPKYRVAILVHGCFWHGHDCPRGKRPTSNTEFWNVKLDLNIVRDAAQADALLIAGWAPLIVWECETYPADALTRNLQAKLGRLINHSEEGL